MAASTTKRYKGLTQAEVVHDVVMLLNEMLKWMDWDQDEKEGETKIRWSVNSGRGDRWMSVEMDRKVPQYGGDVAVCVLEVVH
jgi:hypothetical protein